MPAPLDEEEIDEIIESYAEIGNIEKVADATGYAKDTVSKYVNQAEEEGDPRHPDVTPESERPDVGEPEDTRPGHSPFQAVGVEEELPDYSGMTPGDFIKDFFEDFEVGVNDKWVHIQARRADRRDRLPSKDSLVTDLLNMSSGISKSSHVEANYIADEYWAEASSFLQQTGYSADRASMSSQPQMGNMGMGMQGGGGQGYGNEFVGGQQGMMGQQQAQDPQMQMFQMMMEEMRQMRQQFSQDKQDDQGQDRSRTLRELEMLRQEKEILEELSGGDEHIDKIQQQINQLQQQVMSQESSQPTPNLGGGDSLEDRLLDLAARDDSVSIGDIIDYLQDKDATEDDPEVLEKKYEKEMKELELEHKNERTEKVANTLDSLADRFGAAVGEAIVGGGATPTPEPSDDGTDEAAADGGDTATESPDIDMDIDGPPVERQAAAQPIAAADPGDCEHCGHQLTMTQGGPMCESCQWGVGQCDLCSRPVEIPPVGKANFARCGTCESFLEVPDSEDATVECPDCEWEGTGDELRGEALKCEGCGEYRPIRRQLDEEEIQEAIENIQGA